MAKEYRDYRMALFIKVNSRMGPRMDLAVFLNVGTRFMKGNGVMINRMGRASRH
jgi:hypothetical protein